MLKFLQPRGDLLLLIVSPFYSFIYSLRKISKRDTSSLLYVSLFMSLCAIISPPFADLSTHAYDYLMFQKKTSWDSIIQTNGSDFILYTISFIFAKVGLNFEFIRAIFVFSCYQISFVLFKEIIKSRKDLVQTNFDFFLIFLCFFLSVPFLWIINGLRSATADYFMIYALFLLIKRAYLKTCIFAILSVSTHFFCWIYIPVLLVYIWGGRVNKYIFRILVILSLFVGYLFLAVVFSENESKMVTDQASTLYLDDLNYGTMSTNGFIALILERLPLIYLSIWGFFSLTKWVNTKEQTLFYVNVLLTLLCVTYFIPLQRISWLVMPVLMYLYFKNQVYINLKLLLFTIIISHLAYIYGYRDVFLNTPFYYLLLPCFFSLFHTYPLNFNLLDFK